MSLGNLSRIVNRGMISYCPAGFNRTTFQNQTSLMSDHDPKIDFIKCINTINILKQSPMFNTELSIYRSVLFT